MNYYVFQVSDQKNGTKIKTGREFFNSLVVNHSIWGFKKNASYRKAIQPDDKVLFYLTGPDGQVFVGAATLSSGAYEDKSHESDTWFEGSDILRIDLKDISVFSEPISRMGLDWHPQMGTACRISEKEYFKVLNGVVGVAAKADSVENDMEFALEKYLEEFIVDNWQKIDFGEKLELFTDEEGNTGQQYYTDEAGYIDILAKDSKGNFVVIELKKGRKNDEVIGQVLRYIGWVRRNLVKNNESVRGIVIVGEKDKKLDLALSEVSDKVSAKIYKVAFKLDEYR